MTSQQDTELSLEEILYDYWAKHRDCKDGCQHMNQGEDTIQALTSWKDKEVEAGVKSGFYAGQAISGAELEDCHKAWQRWNTPQEEKDAIKTADFHQVEFKQEYPGESLQSQGGKK